MRLRPLISCRCLLAMAAAACGLIGHAASAAEAEAAYPSRPVTIVVPFSAGSVSDVLGRLVAQKLGDALGQPFVVDNKAGADGNIGTGFVVSARPDGYTLLLGATSATAINPSLHKNLKFDAVKGLAPITNVAAVPNVLVVAQAVPARTVAEFVALASKERYSYASGGAGGTMHLAGELFKSMTGARDLLHVPYRGGSPALNDLLGGQVQAMFCNLPLCLPHIQSGRLAALGVTSKERSPLLPDVPTLSEAGVPGYMVEGWYGLFAPAGTPEAIIRRLNAEVVKALREPEVAGQLLAQGATPVGDAPEDFAVFVQQEHERWAKIIREADITVD